MIVQCVVCGAELPLLLYIYGDLDAPMCQGCYLGLLNDNSPLSESLFCYDDLGDGWLLKQLTEVGALLLGGIPGDALMRVNRSEGRIEVIGRMADASANP